jgi:hypothetical protein
VKLSQEPETEVEQHRFPQTCAYCGAMFDVQVSRSSGHNQDESYSCPECAKGYSVRASRPPIVELKARRRDGKTDGYQETLF